MVLTLVHLLEDLMLDRGDRINRSCLWPFWYAFSFPGDGEDVDMSDFSDGHCSWLGQALFADDGRRAGISIPSSSVDHAVSSLERSIFLTVPDSASLSPSTGFGLMLLLRSDPSRIEGSFGLLLDSALPSDADKQPDPSLLLTTAVLAST